MRIAVIATCLLVAGCAAGGAPSSSRAAGDPVSYDSKRRLSDALKGLTPGQPQTCLPLGRSPSSESFGSTVLYRFGRNEVWRNDTGPGCERMGQNGDVMVVRTPIGRFCRGDIVQLVDRVSGFPSGSCAFGDFIPYRRAK
ncbi:hypothetical protein GCM10011380_03530 [Sphingomonas metalli]|uniref:Lipoprotein n=1 Tax=Sphingomonas metalli TaxID=1779358 RepID=A0A916WP75_9SPHN|nr:hypothetical protein [Sphingomonas metalli]GGB17307.1 hypothetical protein GCM10011380_03530 [Sphingomonas metalli]